MPTPPGVTNSTVRFNADRDPGTPITARPANRTALSSGAIRST